MRSRDALRSLVLAAMLGLWAGPVHAQLPESVPPPATPRVVPKSERTPAPAGLEVIPEIPESAAPDDDRPPTSLIDRYLRRSWDSGERRAFAATTVDLGYLYARPRLSIGYGHPHQKWVGVDVNPTFWTFGVGSYAGLRLSIPHFDIRVGGRYFHALQRSYLAPRSHFNRQTLDDDTYGRSRAITLETEANFAIPLGPGDIVGLGSLSYVTNVPDGLFVFEETLRVMVAPPWVVRGRVGYAFRLGDHDQCSLGLATDTLYVPERGTGVVRVGAILRFMLSRSLELRGAFMPRIHSRDSLGIITEGDFTELGVRWRWATGPQ